MIALIAESHEAGRPVLIGTLDVKESEALAEGLGAAGVPCVVLNAKNDDEEAAIIAEAGTYEAVTVSTQMAGRGVDIRLGGSAKDSTYGPQSGPPDRIQGGDQADRERVAELGGLVVIGSGQHESRRVDDQLRGRAGRQGDPGGSVFFVSLEDDLIVRNAGNELPPSPHMTAGRAGDRRAGRLGGRSCPAGRRGRQPRDPSQHVALQRGDRAAAQGAGGATRARAEDRRDRRHVARAVPGHVEEVDDELLSRAARSIALYHLDRLWAEHLALLSEVREGVHLRALARGRPPRRVPPVGGAGVQRSGPRDRGPDDRPLSRRPT